MQTIGRKSLVWVSIVSMLVCMAAVCGFSLPLAASAQTVLFSENFNSYSNGTLPTNWTISSDSGFKTVSVQDGGLVVNGLGSDAQTRVVYLGSELKNYGDYTFEADYTILQADYALETSTRYSSMMYRVSSSIYPYYYCTTRTKTSMSNELSIRNTSDASSYKQLSLTGAPAQQVLNTTYHLKVVCRGANIQFYIDNKQVFNYTLETSGTNYSYLDKGSIGFTTSNMKVRFDNVVVTEADASVSVQPALYNTYIPKTDIGAAPAAVTYVTDSNVYSTLTGTKLPSTTLYHLNKNMEITTPDGKTVIAKLASALTKTNGKVIPALYIKDQATANALKTFAEQAALQDAFIVADDMSLLQYARGIMPKLYGVLYTKLTTAATKADLQKMVVDTNTAQGKIVMVDADYVCKDDVAFLQKRLMNVWVIDSGMTYSEIYDNVYKGVNGIVNKDHAATISVLESFNTGTPVVIREPFMYAHRGYSAAAPQNTMPAFYAAADYGADLIEMDVRQTKDGVVVIYHDEYLHSLTDCTDTTKTVENSTYAELMKYNVDCMAGFSEKIPTLEQFLEFLKGTDIVGIVELKNYDSALIPLTAQVIKDMDMEHQVVSIAFGAGQAALLRKELPGVSVGLLANANSNYTTAEAIVGWAKNCCLPYNFSFHPNTGVIHTSDTAMRTNVIAVAAVRGFQYQPWTYASQARFDTSYVNGIQGLTTDHLEYDDNYIRKIVAGAEYQLKSGTATAMDALAFTSDGVSVVTPEFVRTGGSNITFKYSGGRVTATGTGTAYGYLRYKSGTSLQSYYLISDLVAVTVSSNGGTTPKYGYHISLLPEYVEKWSNVINTMTVNVTRDSRGEVFTNLTGGYPAVDSACSIRASLSDSIAYNFKVDDHTSIVLTLSNGKSYEIQKYMSGVKLNGDDLVGNGANFRGTIKLSDMISSSDATNGNVTISSVRVFNVGSAGDEILIRQLDLVKNVPSPVKKLGDLNNDSSVSTVDARLVMNAAIGCGGLSYKQSIAGDMNSDGLINTSDARLILLEAISN